METLDSKKTKKGMTPKDVVEFAKESGVQVIDYKFMDLPGTLQHCMRECDRVGRHAQQILHASPALSLRVLAILEGEDCAAQQLVHPDQHLFQYNEHSLRFQPHALLPLVIKRSVQRA